MLGLENHAPIFGLNMQEKQDCPPPAEGELFKVITAYGRTFELRYGYYSDSDRENPHIEPMEMYPDFIALPLYTDDGIPFATAMQRRCSHFRLKSTECDHDEDNTCFNCFHYEKCEELLGVCRCTARQKNTETR